MYLINGWSIIVNRLIYFVGKNDKKKLFRLTATTSILHEKCDQFPTTPHTQQIIIFQVVRQIKSKLTFLFRTYKPKSVTALSIHSAQHKFRCKDFHTLYS